jgi:hypothetical protein
LETDQLSCKILRFLLENESAMDSAKGIAAWWVHQDELAVQPSLHRLVACGALLAHTLGSGTTLYGLTQDPEVRAWLRDTLAVQRDQKSGTGNGRRATRNPSLNHEPRR